MVHVRIVAPAEKAAHVHGLLCSTASAINVNQIPGATKNPSGDAWERATADDGTPPECRGCPVCRVRRTLAEVNPEVFEHLADAVGSLGAALRAWESRDRRGPRA